MPRRNTIALALGLLLAFACSSLAQDGKARSVDVLVYGGTPAGIAAANAAGSQGQTVLLVEPTNRIGGLVTSGLSHTDFHSLESLTGAFWQFARRVKNHYAQEYGADSPQAKASFHGTFAEPKVNLLVYESWLAENPRIEVIRQHRLEGVKLESDGSMSRIGSVEFVSSDGSRLRVEPKMVIDATYEGDLMAAAGVPWRAGREGRDEYGESLAPEKADDQLQAYNFRFIMTQDPENRILPEPPAGYNREDFLPVVEILESGRIEKIFGYPSKCIFKAQTPALPNGKYDINDVSRGLVRLSLPGVNLGWPAGDAATREQIFAEQLRDQVGLLYFLQNDEAVPERFREEARSWGWCRDEFLETGHISPQLYVREARRMVGQYIYTQADSEHAPGDARAKLHRDSIAMADYGNNCHGTFHEGPRFGGRHTGEFYNRVPPYQIPYGILVPKERTNLLVPGAMSSTHVGFCALRLEPVWMSLGQAAGHAAALAIQESTSVQSVPVDRIQARLHKDDSATIYVNDCLPGHADFAAVQWWGTLGGLHGLHPMPSEPGQRGKNLHGQYYEANPFHAVDLDKPLDPATAKRWRAITEKLGLSHRELPTENDRATRGDFIRAAYRSS
jgi:hypothetical protein